jgi:hypothetical protein
MSLRDNLRQQIQNLNTRRDARPQPVPAQRDGTGVSIGGNRVRAQSVTNEALVTGDAVVLSSDSGVVQQERRRIRRGTTEGRAIKNYGRIKALATWVVNGKQQIWVGGHVATPILVWEAPLGIYPSATLSNTGRGKNDWIVAIAYQTPTQEFNHVTITGQGERWEHLDSKSFAHQGFGFWSAIQVFSQLGGGGSDPAPLTYPPVIEVESPASGWPSVTAPLVGSGHRRHEGLPPRLGVTGVNIYDQEWSETRALLNNNSQTILEHSFLCNYSRKNNTTSRCSSLYKGVVESKDGTTEFSYSRRREFFDHRRVNSDIAYSDAFENITEAGKVSENLEVILMPNSYEKTYCDAVFNFIFAGDSLTSNFNHNYDYVIGQQLPYATFDNTIINRDFAGVGDSKYLVGATEYIGTFSFPVFGVNADNCLYFILSAAQKSATIRIRDRKYSAEIVGTVETYWRSPVGDNKITLLPFDVNRHFWGRNFQVSGDTLLDHQIFLESANNNQELLTKDITVLVETQVTMLPIAWIKSEEEVILKNFQMPEGAVGYVLEAAYF